MGDSPSLVVTRTSNPRNAIFSQRRGYDATRIKQEDEPVDIQTDCQRQGSQISHLPCVFDNSSKLSEYINPFAKMDKATAGNRTNQKNPNHGPTGPGKNAGYTGASYNQDNRANQLNPNNPNYAGSKK